MDVKPPHKTTKTAKPHEPTVTTTQQADGTTQIIIQVPEGATVKTVPAGNSVAANSEPNGKEKKWIVALLLSIFVGGLGVDRFYLGHIGLGILKLLTGGGFGVWWLIDLILIATKNIKGIAWVE